MNTQEKPPVAFYISVNEGTGEYVSFQEPDLEQYVGMEDTVASVYLDDGTYTFSVDSYYAPDMELKLVITQPEERAIRTFIKLLEADSEEERSGVSKWPA